jgi:hypothetical protein
MTHENSSLPIVPLKCSIENVIYYWTHLTHSFSTHHEFTNCHQDCLPDEMLFCSMSPCLDIIEMFHSLVCLCVCVFQYILVFARSFVSSLPICSLLLFLKTKDFWTKRPLVLLDTHKMALLASYIASICEHKQEHLHPHHTLYLGLNPY